MNPSLKLKPGVHTPAVSLNHGAITLLLWTVRSDSNKSGWHAWVHTDDCFSLLNIFTVWGGELDFLFLLNGLLEHFLFHCQYIHTHKYIHIFCMPCKHYANPMRWLGAFVMGFYIPFQSAQSQRYSAYCKISSSLTEKWFALLPFNPINSFNCFSRDHVP